MVNLQLTLHQNKGGGYSWQLSKNHQLMAKGLADLLPSQQITLRDTHLELGDISDKLLTFNENEAWLETVFDEAGQIQLGTYLYQQTLGQVAALTESHEETQLVVISEDAFIRHLPWNILSRDGRTFLVLDDWRINVATHASTKSVQFSAHPRILLVCPDVLSEGFAPTQGRQHREDLKQELSAIHGLFNSPEYCALCASWDDFCERVKQRWDVIYFYGHGVGDAYATKLIFADEQGGLNTFPSAKWRLCYESRCLMCCI